MSFCDLNYNFVSLLQLKYRELIIVNQLWKESTGGKSPISLIECLANHAMEEVQGSARNKKKL